MLLDDLPGAGFWAQGLERAFREILSKLRVAHVQHFAAIMVGKQQTHRILPVEDEFDARNFFFRVTLIIVQIPLTRLDLANIGQYTCIELLLRQE